MGPSRPSIFLLLLLSVVVCMSASLGSSSSDLVESEFLKVPISEFANSVWSTIDVVQQGFECRVNVSDHVQDKEAALDLDR
ncbi:hypothetical protein LOK49_LG04G00020 [Camellia lanceoleosa]|uniref:Uncharacterized protein n=1 Tax=Camellia lanceoleosa TaxID=1840588 RepID=A0ACC0I127_9ERIC|nr:hypothetical protein LOK49_LG04G00020 [Camellia lanceoleosa]